MSSVLRPLPHNRIAKQLLEQARLRIESLEQQLVWREEKVQTALQGQRELQDRVTAYHTDFEREKEDIFDISADMTRQYKGMQEELIAQINKLEQTIAERDDQVEKLQVSLEEVRRQMTVELALKDNEIEGQKQKMEDMAMEFGEVRACDPPTRPRRSRRATSSRTLAALRQPLMFLLGAATEACSACSFFLACSPLADAQGDSRQDERENRDHKPGLGSRHGRQHRQEARGAQDGCERRPALRECEHARFLPSPAALWRFVYVTDGVHHLRRATTPKCAVRGGCGGVVAVC